MSDPFIGEIKMFAFDFLPNGWRFCDGQLLSISQNTALFSLLGTNYGGDGRTTFALPDLRSRAPLHYGQGLGLSAYSLGQTGGEESHTLTSNEMPSHSHTVQANSGNGTSTTPTSNYWAASSQGNNLYSASADSLMNAGAIANVGGQAHENRQPLLALNYSIAMQGIYPSRSAAPTAAPADRPQNATPYLGEIIMFGSNFAPAGWAFCNGQLLAISQNDALFSLLGTTYGGDGQSTFALPDLRSRTAVHRGQGPGLSSYIIGQALGVEQVTLSNNQLPSHSHAARAQSAAGESKLPTGNYWAQSTNGDLHYKDSASQSLAAASISTASGGSQPHQNIQPYLATNFVIAVEGIYPSPGLAEGGN